MIVKDLIDELQKLPQDLPICINDYMGFAEASENTITVEKKLFLCFPYGEENQFEYVNLKGQKFDY